MIVVVGVGALGSHVGLFLRNYPLRVIDFDRVEAKNVLAQVHGKPWVGRTKALGFHQLMLSVFGVTVEARPYRFDYSNAEALLSGASLVIDCLDNAPSRRMVQAECAKACLPLLHGAVSGDGTFGRVEWSPDFVVDEGSGGATCEAGEHLPFHATVAAHVARSAQAFMESRRKLSFHVFSAGVRQI